MLFTQGRRAVVKTHWEKRHTGNLGVSRQSDLKENRNVVQDPTAAVVRMLGPTRVRTLGSPPLAWWPVNRPLAWWPAESWDSVM